MSGNTNIVLMEGRLTRDPSFSKTKNNKSICKFSLANNRYYYSENQLNNNVSFFNFVSWGHLAEKSASKLRKGSHVFIRGEIRDNTYISKTGDKKNSVYILALDIKFLDKASPSSKNISTSKSLSKNIIKDSIEENLEINF